MEVQGLAQPFFCCSLQPYPLAIKSPTLCAIQAHLSAPRSHANGAYLNTGRCLKLPTRCAAGRRHHCTASSASPPSAGAPAAGACSGTGACTGPGAPAPSARSAGRWGVCRRAGAGRDRNPVRRGPRPTRRAPAALPPGPGTAGSPGGGAVREQSDALPGNPSPAGCQGAVPPCTPESSTTNQSQPRISTLRRPGACL